MPSLLPRRRRDRAATISCALVQESVSAALDGEPGPVRPATVEAHLSRCPDCQEFARAWRAAGSSISQRVGAMRLAPARPAPDELVARVRADAPEPAAAHRPGGMRWPVDRGAVLAGSRWLAVAAPAAVVAVLQIGPLHQAHAATNPTRACSLRPPTMWVSAELTSSYKK